MSQSQLTLPGLLPSGKLPSLVILLADKPRDSIRLEELSRLLLEESAVPTFAALSCASEDGLLGSGSDDGDSVLMPDTH